MLNRFAKMSLAELQEVYLNELREYKDSIPNSVKYRWLERIGEDKELDPVKVRTARGYLMGLRDCGKNIGDLKIFLEFISSKIEGEEGI